MDLIFFVARIFRTRDRRNRRDRKEQPPGEILQMETPNLFEPIPEFSEHNTDAGDRRRRRTEQTRQYNTGQHRRQTHQKETYGTRDIEGETTNTRQTHKVGRTA